LHGMTASTWHQTARRRSPYRLRPWLAVLLAAWACASEPLVLRTAGQVSTAPKYVQQGGKVVGVCPALLAAIQAKDGHIQFTGLEVLLSTPLVEKGLQSGQLDVFCGLVKSANRQQSMRFLEPPLYHIQMRVMSRRDIGAPRDVADLRERSQKVPVIATAGLSTTRTLMEQGVKVDASSSDNLSSLRRLQAGRGQYYYSSDEILLGLMASEHLGDWAVIQPTVFGEEDMYMVTSRQLPAEAQQRLHRALEQLAASGELKQVVVEMKKQYGGL